MRYPELHELLKSSDNIVFFGGAGVSTESGIPDFRSETGIYNAIKRYGNRPERILSHSYFMDHTLDFYKFHREVMIYPDAQPNRAHLALAELERIGKLRGVITQNIDGLHQKAGSKIVYELHGSILRNNCMRCGKAYGLETVTESEGIPHCEVCGPAGVIKPDVVLYEEPLDSIVMSDSIAAIRQAQVMIVGGTSLAVYPAAGLIEYFKGKSLVIINKSTTPYDNRADLVIGDSIGSVLGECVLDNPLADC
jgi:NAD-dependent deacetylase